MVFLVVRDRVGGPSCCAIVSAGFQSVPVLSPRYSGHVSKWSQVSSSVWPQMHWVYPAGMRMERRAIGSVG